MFTEEMARLVDMTDADLHERVRCLELDRRRLDAELAAALAVADRRQLNAAIDGHRTMRTYLRAELNYSTAEANRWLGVAKMASAHPAVGEAWIRGHIGAAQTATFARTHANRRVTDRLAEFVTVLVDQAEQLPYTDFATCIEAFVARADIDGAHDSRDDAIAHRRALVTEVGGTLHIDAFGGDGLVAAELIAIHRRFAELEFQKDCEARCNEAQTCAGDLARTSAQRNFDAIVEIFRRGAQSGANGRSVEPVVNIVVDAGTFALMQAEAGLAPSMIDGHRVDPFTGLVEPMTLLDELLGRPDDLERRRCETSTGIQLHPHDVLRASLAGHVRRVVVDRAGVITDLGRKSRLYTGSAREAAKLLVRHCQRPGCEVPAEFCDVDHNDEWAGDQGSTDQSNAAILCSGDNLDKHHHRWRRRRAANGRTFTVRPDGTVMMPVGARIPVRDPLIDKITTVPDAKLDDRIDSDCAMKT